MDTNKVTAVIPLHDNILLEGIEAKTRTDGGLIIPERHQDAPPQGKVIDKGPGVSEYIKLGDILFYPHSAESALDYKGKKMKMVPESAVLGLIREMTKTDYDAYQENLKNAAAATT